MSTLYLTVVIFLSYRTEKKAMRNGEWKTPGGMTVVIKVTPKKKQKKPSPHFVYPPKSILLRGTSTQTHFWKVLPDFAALFLPARLFFFTSYNSETHSESLVSIVSIKLRKG